MTRVDWEVERLLNRGLVAMATGRQDEAIQLWQEALERSPDNDRAIDYLQTAGALPDTDGEIEIFDEMGWESDASLPVISLDEPADGAGDLGPDGLPFVTGEPPPVDSGEYPVPRMDGSAELEGLTGDGKWASGRFETVPPDPAQILALAQSEFDRMEFEESLYHCEEIVRHVPDHVQAKALAQRNRDYLMARYGEYIGDLEQIPKLAIDSETLDDLSHEPLSAYVLGQVDGLRSMREIIQDAPNIEAFALYRTLHFLLNNGIIELVGP